MSLRWRLLLTLGLSFAALWVLVAVWLYSDLRDQVRDTLDQRLAASARMVAGLVAQLPESAWQNTGEPVLSVPSSAGVACQINAPSGRVLMRTHGEFDDGLDSPRPGFTDRDIDGERWRLFTYVQNGVHITTADRLVERSALQRNVIAVAAVPFVVALLGSLVVLWFGIRRGLRPLERLRDELSRRAPDALIPIEIDNAPTELRPAVDTLNQLLVRTGETLAREQRFTSDAAHELRTPLTAIKTHVQLAKRLDGDKAYAALAQAEAGIARVAGPCGNYAIADGQLAVDTAEGRMQFDSIYPALGSNVRSKLARDVGARTTQEGCIVTDDHLRTSIEGLYAAGDVVLGLDQISHAMGQAGVASTTIRNDLAQDNPIRR